MKKEKEELNLDIQEVPVPKQWRVKNSEVQIMAISFNS